MNFDIEGHVEQVPANMKVEKESKNILIQFTMLDLKLMLNQLI